MFFTYLSSTSGGMLDLGPRSLRGLQHGSSLICCDI